MIIHWNDPLRRSWFYKARHSINPVPTSAQDGGRCMFCTASDSIPAVGKMAAGLPLCQILSRSEQSNEQPVLLLAFTDVTVT
jgi:hypothetical protein